MPRTRAIIVPALSPQFTIKKGSLRVAEYFAPLLRTESSVRGIRLCGLPYPCGHALCPRCCTRKASTARARLRRYAASSGLSAVYVVLSLPSTRDLASGWDALASARSDFRPWLKEVSTFWSRFTELTRSPLGLWHWHDSLLVFGTGEQLDTLLEGIDRHWSGRAHASRVRSMHATTRYVSKGVMAPSSASEPGSTPGDLARDWLLRGDADAADAWRGLEEFWILRHPRLVSSSRASTIDLAPVQPEDPEQIAPPPRRRGAVFTIHDYLGVQHLPTVRERAEALGCSVRTIHNLRQQLERARRTDYRLAV